MHKLLIASAAALGLAGPAIAAGGGGHVEDVSFSFEGPLGTFDQAQLQRGFQIYHEVCRACHGLQYVAFRTLGDEFGPGYPDEQIKAIAAEYEVTDPELEPGETRPGKPADKFPAVTGAGAPDLSLMAKARAGFHGPSGLGLSQLVNGMGGPEYIFSILTGYTGETEEMAGTTLYENHAFPGGYISMTPPLSEDLVEYSEGQPAPTVEQMAEDVAAFLMWTAEPKMTERKMAGFRNIGFLILLAVLFYLTNKKLWASVKRKD
jgi:ubiquinol-cytochrome c reductase cytochrome c1 subunit